MTRLEVERLLPRTQVTLRSGPNWTAVLFCACLASLHFYIATSAMLHQRWEGFMSWIFAAAFSAIALICWLVRSELTVFADEARLRLRTGSRRVFVQRFVPFSHVRNVRLTLLHPKPLTAARIELVCRHEVIECPPTTVPREQALCLAMTMGVGLVKVYGEDFGPVAERLDRLPLA